MQSIRTTHKVELKQAANAVCWNLRNDMQGEESEVRRKIHRMSRRSIGVAVRDLAHNKGSEGLESEAWQMSAGGHWGSIVSHVSALCPDLDQST